MSDQATVRVDHTGSRPLVIKEARRGPAADRVRTEATVLRAAQHPGVVTLVDFSDDAHGAVLRTRFCGSRTLANAGSLGIERVAGLVAALATTVADLHDLGIHHGRITPDHVLISADGRPVLCGFAEAATGSSRDDAADDVAALGALLRDVLAPLDDVAPIPAARIGRRSSWPGYQRRALLNLADQASADDPFIRPTARQFAINLRATVPGATLAASEDPNDGGFGAMPYDTTEDPPPPRWRTVVPRRGGVRSNRLVLLGASSAALILLATISVTLAIPGDGRATTELHTQMAAPPDARSSTTTTAPPRLTTTTAEVERSGASSTSTTAPAPDPPPTPTGPSDLDTAAGCSAISGSSTATLAAGTACPTHLSIEGGVLTVGESTFHLELTDASVAVGDFACTGSVHAAVLDRETGDLFVFERWASDDSPTTASVLERIEGSSRLLAEPRSPDPCHRLVVLDTFGIRHVIDTTASEELP